MEVPGADASSALKSLPEPTSKPSTAVSAAVEGPKLSAGALLLREAAQSMANEDLYVILDFKLVNFSYLDFKLLVKTSTPIHLIKRQLVERHGRMSELHLFKGGVSAETELLNDAWTLAEYGIIGKRKSEVPDTLAIFYNFIPHAHGDALLLATHTRERLGVN